jgi:hypothetical protein
LEVGSFYLSDAAAFAGHNCIENDHELRRADLRVANRLSDPKFRRDSGQLLTIRAVRAQRCGDG